MQKTLAQLVYGNPYLADDGEDVAERVWRLRHAFFGAKAGQVIEVAAEDVKAVCAVFAKPDGDGKRTAGRCDKCGGRGAVRWNGELASFCVPFIRAWKAASIERPRALEPGEVATPPAVVSDGWRDGRGVRS